MRTQLNNGREYELEEQYGLPEKLPSSERIEWQGSPNTLKVAKNIFYNKIVDKFNPFFNKKLIEEK